LLANEGTIVRWPGKHVNLLTGHLLTGHVVGQQ